MDRQSIVGFILIFIVLVVWMWLNSPQKNQSPDVVVKKSTKDSIKIEQEKAPEFKEIQKPDSLGKYFSNRVKGTERLITIETDLYTVVISSKGGLIRKWELKKYKTWDGYASAVGKSSTRW